MKKRRGWSLLTCTISSLVDFVLLTWISKSNTLTVAVFVLPPQLAVTVFGPVFDQVVVNVAPVPVAGFAPPSAFHRTLARLPVPAAVNVNGLLRTKSCLVSGLMPVKLHGSAAGVQSNQKARTWFT